ncbi:MAG: hypothetical protein ACI9D5_001933 [Candidatus Endobugula sp.]|jgi:hypothetical protein
MRPWFCEGCYAQSINKTSIHLLTLWKAEHNAIAIDEVLYCVKCYRYIQFYPVKTAIKK